jgi:hypothetical protein
MPRSSAYDCTPLPRWKPPSQRDNAHGIHSVESCSIGSHPQSSCPLHVRRKDPPLLLSCSPDDVNSISGEPTRVSCFPLPIQALLLVLEDALNRAVHLPLNNDDTSLEERTACSIPELKSDVALHEPRVCKRTKQSCGKPSEGLIHTENVYSTKQGKDGHEYIHMYPAGKLKQ